jgi:hypothetical protein
MKSYGYLKYDPRYEKNQGKPTRYDDWWLILKAGAGITKYYQWFLQREGVWPVSSRDWLDKAGLPPNINVAWPIMQRGIKVQSSAWGPHVSVIRGEVPLHPELWKKHENKRVWFEYNPKYLNTNGKHWWIRVVSPELESIREELGLTPQPVYFHRNSGEWRVNPFHLTIGHMLN